MVYVAYMNNRGWPIYNRELGFVNIPDKGKKSRQKIGGLIGWTWEVPMSVRFWRSYLTKEMFYSYFGKMFCSNEITTSASWRKKPCLPLALPDAASLPSKRTLATSQLTLGNLDPTKQIFSHPCFLLSSPAISTAAFPTYDWSMGLTVLLVTLLANIAFLLIIQWIGSTWYLSVIFLRIFLFIVVDFVPVWILYLFNDVMEWNESDSDSIIILKLEFMVPNHCKAFLTFFHLPLS